MPGNRHTATLALQSNKAALWILHEVRVALGLPVVSHVIADEWRDSLGWDVFENWGSGGLYRDGDDNATDKKSKQDLVNTTFGKRKNPSTCRFFNNTSVGARKLIEVRPQTREDFLHIVEENAGYRDDAMALYQLIDREGQDGRHIFKIGITNGDVMDRLAIHKKQLCPQLELLEYVSAPFGDDVRDAENRIKGELAEYFDKVPKKTEAFYLNDTAGSLVRAQRIVHHHIRKIYFAITTVRTDQ